MKKIFILIPISLFLFCEKNINSIDILKMPLRYSINDYKDNNFDVVNFGDIGYKISKDKLSFKFKNHKFSARFYAVIEKNEYLTTFHISCDTKTIKNLMKDDWGDYIQFYLKDKRYLHINYKVRIIFILDYEKNEIEVIRF